jgi:hypothetical protein
VGGVTRPEWADVARYAEARDRAENLVTSIEAAGFTVVEEENGYSVRVRLDDRTLTGTTARSLQGRQVGIFTVTVNGIFWWGWVEHPSGTGRTDYYHFRSFLNALQRKARSTR